MAAALAKFSAAEKSAPASQASSRKASLSGAGLPPAVQHVKIKVHHKDTRVLLVGTDIDYSKLAELVCKKFGMEAGALQFSFRGQAATGPEPLSDGKGWDRCLESAVIAGDTAKVVLWATSEAEA